MLRTTLLFLALAAPPVFGNDLLPGIRFSTHDAGADGTADSFNAPPLQGLMQRAPFVADDRAMQEFDVAGFAWQSIAVATISGTVAATDATNSGMRAFTFRLYPGNGAADLADHSAPAGVFGQDWYWPPAEPSFAYSYDVTHQLTTLMLGGASWIGLRVQCVNNWDAGSTLALATNTRLRILLQNGSGFCFGDGSGTACPCGNDSAPGAGQGCRNSSGSGALLRGGGIASVTNDTFTLRCVLAGGFALVFQGTSTVNGGSGATFGDGLRCAGGTVMRIATKSFVEGVLQYPEGGEAPISIRGLVPAAGGVRHYQVWYRNFASPCSIGVSTNLSNGWTVTWVP